MLNIRVTSFMDGPFEARLMWPLGNFLINFLSSPISFSPFVHIAGKKS